MLNRKIRRALGAQQADSTPRTSFGRVWAALKDPIRFPRAALFGVVSSILLATSVQTVSAETSATAFLNGKQTVAAPDGFSGVCGRYPWVCSKSSNNAPLSDSVMGQIKTINQRINSQTRQIEDVDQYNVQEFWTLPTNRGGDCEDIAMLKMRELMSMGVDPARLMLATVLDRKNRNHAVLVLRTDAGDLVLDSQTSRILHWASTGYSFIRMQNPSTRSLWQSLFMGGKFS